MPRKLPKCLVDVEFFPNVRVGIVLESGVALLGTLIADVDRHHDDPVPPKIEVNVPPAQVEVNLPPPDIKVEPKIEVNVPPAQVEVNLPPPDIKVEPKIEVNVPPAEVEVNLPPPDIKFEPKFEPKIEVKVPPADVKVEINSTEFLLIQLLAAVTVGTIVFPIGTVVGVNVNEIELIGPQ